VAMRSSAGGSAAAIMVGNILAGTQEALVKSSPLPGPAYKDYRGMGSEGANEGGIERSLRPGQRRALRPEGVEGRVPYKGALHDTVHQLIGGIRLRHGLPGRAHAGRAERASKVRKDYAHFARATSRVWITKGPRTTPASI